MSRILILGAGKAQAAFVQHCLAKGHDIYLVDGNKDVLSNAIDHKSLHKQLIDITKADEVLTYAKRINPDAVIAPSNDAGLLSAAIVADHIGVPGPGLFAAQNSRNKFKFRKLLWFTGLTTPWYLQADKSNTEDLIPKIPSYPCVIKPVQGSGSKGVRFLASASDLEAYLHDTLESTAVSDYQIEEFVEGVEFSIEGIVQNGNLTTIAVCEKERSELPNLVDTRVIYPSKLTVGELEQAHDMARKIVEALRVENAPIHLEFIKSPKLGFVAVECAVRAAGFNLFNRMVPWCTGVDTLEVQLNLVLGRPLQNIEPIRRYAGILDFPQPPHSGRLKAIHYQKPPDSRFVTEIEVYKEIGEIVSPASNGSERIGHIFIFTEKESEAHNILESLNFSIEIDDLNSEVSAREPN